MKLRVICLLVSFFIAPSSIKPSVKVINKAKTISYDNYLVIARSRSIFVFISGCDHSIEEISRMNTPLPIQSLVSLKSRTSRYLFAYCKLGSINRVCVWNMDDPNSPRKIELKKMLP